jgi:hypothetical protein
MSNDSLLPISVELTEGKAICLDSVCIGCICEETDFEPIYTECFEFFVNPIIDEERKIAYRKRPRIGMDLTEELLEVKDTRAFSGFLENPMHIIQSNTIKSPEVPLMTRQYNIPTSLKLDGKLMTRKAQFYNCKIYKATFDNGTWTLFPHVFGKFWDFDVAFDTEDDFATDQSMFMWHLFSDQPQDNIKDDPGQMVWSRIAPLKKITLDVEELDEDDGGLKKRAAFGLLNGEGEVEEF